MDSFCESMNSYHIVTTNPGFVSYRGSQILTWKDTFRIVDHESSHFQKIGFADSFRDAIFKRFDESNESSRILSTIDIRIHTNPVLPDSRIPTVFKRFVLWIRFVPQCSKDSFCGFVSWRNFQKIRFVDSFRDAIFKRFVSWMRFVRKKVKKVCFVSIRNDLYTNPASLLFLLNANCLFIPFSSYFFSFFLGFIDIDVKANKENTCLTPFKSLSKRKT